MVKLQIQGIQSKAKLLASIILVIMGVGLISYKPQTQRSSVNFSSEPVELKGFSDTDSSPDEIPNRIIIPNVNIDLEVQKSDIVNGFWEVPEISAGWGEGSGVPGKIGNQVIFAHAREGLFLPIRDVSIQDEIYVLTKDHWYAYKVVEIKEVTPDETQVIEPTDDQTLTLYTCSGFRDEKRLIVIAKPKR